MKQIFSETHYFFSQCQITPPISQSASEAYSVMAKVSKEKSIWRQLCRFHWTPAQIEYIIQLHRELRVQKNWREVYDRLRRWVLGVTLCMGLEGCIKVLFCESLKMTHTGSWGRRDAYNLILLS